MDELLSSVTGLVKKSLDAAGDLAGDAAQVATGAARSALDMYERTYDSYIAQGMTPADAADAAERTCRNYLRDVYGIHVL